MNELKKVDIVTIIAGTTVPGKYLGGKPISLKEIEYYGRVANGTVVLSGPIVNCRFQFKNINHFAWEIPGGLEFKLITAKDLTEQYTSQQLIDRWAFLGAKVTHKHPNYPNLMCEIETFRGCLRKKSLLFFVAKG